MGGDLTPLQEIQSAYSKPYWQVGIIFDGYCVIMIYHHHHVVLPAQISLTLSPHRSLSSIAPRKSSRLYPVSAQSFCIYVLAGRLAFSHPCDGVHRSMLLMNSSLLLQQCPACPVCLTWIVFMMGGRWPYSCCFLGCCFLGCCFQDLFNIVYRILL